MDIKNCMACKFNKDGICSSAGGEIKQGFEIDSFSKYRSCFHWDIHHFLSTFPSLNYQDWFYYSENSHIDESDVMYRVSYGQWEDEDSFVRFMRDVEFEETDENYYLKIYRKGPTLIKREPKKSIG